MLARGVGRRWVWISAVGVDAGGEGRIMAKDSGPESGAKGVVEDLKGKAKEAAGAVTGSGHLRREGRAQQEKADAQREVAAREAEADKARAKAAEKQAEEDVHRR
jgi:uncharacterized protein YjbJ (UPF0337 family)